MEKTVVVGRGPARETIEVLVVDDSAIVRQVIPAILERDREVNFHVVTASDPIIAQKKMALLPPDVIILDLNLPRMDGLSFLRQLMKERPRPVIVCSSYAPKGSDAAFQALEEGAVEIVTKPEVGVQEFLYESAVTLTDAVKAACQARLKRIPAAGKAAALTPSMLRDRTREHDFKPRPHTPEPRAIVPAIKPPPAPARFPLGKVVALGASTGGTEAVQEILMNMPPNSPGVVVVLHMPEGFTNAYARRLNDLCLIAVKEAENGDEVLRGRALIAPGNRHLTLKRSSRGYWVEVTHGPLVSRHRPSVDVLFHSVAETAGPNAVGVLMTGMGRDGAEGLLAMKKAGADTIAQDEATSVVFGMPKEAIELGAALEIVPLNLIAGAILKKCYSLLPTP